MAKKKVKKPLKKWNDARKKPYKTREIANCLGSSMWTAQCCLAGYPLSEKYAVPLKKLTNNEVKIKDWGFTLCPDDLDIDCSISEACRLLKLQRPIIYGVLKRGLSVKKYNAIVSKLTKFEQWYIKHCNEFTIEEVCEAIDNIAGMTLYRWLDGKEPSAKYDKAIKKLTKSKVSRKDWMI